MQRMELDTDYSERLFRRGTGVHRKNFLPTVGNGPMRGGIRL